MLPWEAEYTNVPCFKERAVKKDYKTDVALLSVTATEFQAVTHFHKWTPLTFTGDEQIYDAATFTRDGRQHTLIHAKIDEMGMPAAAATAMKVIYTFRPRYLIMVGFGNLGFLPRTTYLSIPEEIMPYLRQAVDSPENPAHAYIGPMACGSVVVANRELLEKQVYTQYHHTAGLDMESYAVVYAATHANDLKPIPIIAKSVCDFADSQKSDDYQRFAAYSSCEFARFLYEKILPME